MKKIGFVFGVHNHQPVGNFDFVFEDAYQKAYRPFLEILARHPRIRIALHFSGILLEWIRDHHPDYIDRLRELVRSGQVEMMTGAYYEPILAVIPDPDKRGQICKLTQFVEELTGYRPRGFWLAERVWEPHLPKCLKEAGIDYTIVDDAHFKYSGLKEDRLTGYYLTEEQGVPLFIFPISERLRYTIPFEDPEATLDYMRWVASQEGDRIAIFADDGEKFGIWPGTYDHVYKQGWLDQFFSTLEENSDWIEMLHFSEALERVRPLGRVYLPTASYREMMEWALPPKAFQELEDFQHRLQELGLLDTYRIYVRGGYWRNFLAKYPEANHMHKKMLWVSQKVWGAEGKVDQSLFQRALDHLWAGQCNCPYWHGVFGGLYLPHLRAAIYQNLIRAETLIEEGLRSRGEQALTIKHQDFDCDGLSEILVETPDLNLYFAPEIGGALYELDYKPKAVNLLDILSRVPEGYHRKLVEARPVPTDHNEGQVASIHDLVLSKEEGLEKRLFYDWYRRGSFIDHFLGSQTTLEDFYRCQYGEEGDFVNQPYRAYWEEQPEGLRLTLNRLGGVWHQGQRIPLQVEKSFFIPRVGSYLQVRYRLRNKGSREVPLLFGIEFNWAMGAGSDPDRFYEVPKGPLADNRLQSKGEIPGIKELRLVDGKRGIQITLRFNGQADVWHFPIETISLSEAGFERVYQSSALLAYWKFRLSPEEGFELCIDQLIETI